MPRILIMHASVGAGHASAAHALAEAFERKQAGEVRVADIFDYGSQVFREMVTQSYLQLSSKAPLLWKMLYETTDTTDTGAGGAAQPAARALRPPAGVEVRALRAHV